MKEKKKIDKEDIDLFLRTVGPVKRIQHSRVARSSARPAPTPRETLRDEEQVLRDMLSDQYDVADVETGEELIFARPGLQHGQLAKLRRGRFSINAELDLHGMTSVTARHALATFLRNCRINGARCVRIVHGKGHGSKHKIPVLKNKVNKWLRQREEVLAFCSARQVDGGTGAVYVLLKSR